MKERVASQSLVLGRLLYFFAAYTVLIKYILPIAWAVLQKVSLTSYIYFWDAWWLAHLIVGFHLVRCTPGIWKWAILLALTEIGIISTKFAIYFQNPAGDFWHWNWFVNKLLLLFYFLTLLFWLLHREVQTALRDEKKKS